MPLAPDSVGRDCLLWQQWACLGLWGIALPREWGALGLLPLSLLASVSNWGSASSLPELSLPSVPRAPVWHLGLSVITKELSSGGRRQVSRTQESVREAYEKGREGRGRSMRG